jgi:hypothetical protein
MIKEIVHIGIVLVVNCVSILLRLFAIMFLQESVLSKVAALGATIVHEAIDGLVVGISTKAFAAPTRSLVFSVDSEVAK